MSDAGVFAVHRGFFGHTAFREEPFTEREAWLWLIGNAAWKPMQKRIKRAVFDLERGQIACARSYMAEAWQWDESRVRRFLDRMAKLQMISRKATSDATIITICNYDEYQFGRPAERPAADQLPTSSRPQEEELNNSKNSAADAANGDALSKEAWRVVGECEIAIGIDPDFIPPEWFGAHARVEMGLRTGWNSKTIIESVKAQAARKTDPPKRFIYYENGIAEAHARAAAPVPQAKIVDAQTFEVRRHAASKDLVAAARGMQGSGFKLGPKPGAGGVENSATVFLLPKGGGD